MIKANEFSPGWKKILFRIQGFILKKWAIKESIAHWERMIAWIKEQDEEEYYIKMHNQFIFNWILLLNRMESQLGETWRSKYCPLCTLWGNRCEDCTLKKVERYIDRGCGIGSRWSAVNRSNSLKEWLENAKKMVELLESLL